MHSHTTPTFSIITVTYNAAATIEDTIQSVVSQSYRHWQYIIIDGASTDGTLSIVKRYEHLISKVVSEPDKGLYHAMNKGLHLATGDYVCFLNAGDGFHEDDTLLHIVQGLTDELPDVIYGETEIVDADGHFVRMRRLQAPKALNWKSFRQGMLVCHQAFMPRRLLAPDYDLRYRFSADFDWCIRILRQAQHIHNTNLTLIDYQEGGMTTRNHRSSLIERFKIMCRHYGCVSTVFYHLWFVLRLALKK